MQELIDVARSFHGDLNRVSISDCEGIALFKTIQQNSFKKTLEIGFAYGVSSFYIMSANIDVPHIVIDPFQSKYFNMEGMQNIKKIGYSKRLQWLNESSHTALPKILHQNKKFDFIFIDGGHLFDQIFIDFFFSDLLIEKKGYIVFHDSDNLPAVQKMEKWISLNKESYCRMPSENKNLSFFKKVGLERTKKYDHYEDF